MLHRLPPGLVLNRQTKQRKKVLNCLKNKYKKLAPRFTGFCRHPNGTFGENLLHFCSWQVHFLLSLQSISTLRRFTEVHWQFNIMTSIRVFHHPALGHVCHQMYLHQLSFFSNINSLYHSNPHQSNMFIGWVRRAKAYPSPSRLLIEPTMQPRLTPWALNSGP